MSVSLSLHFLLAQVVLVFTLALVSRADLVIAFMFSLSVQVVLPHHRLAPSHYCPTTVLPHHRLASPPSCPTTVLSHLRLASPSCPTTVLPHHRLAPPPSCPTTVLPRRLASPPLTLTLVHTPEPYPRTCPHPWTLPSHLSSHTPEPYPHRHTYAQYCSSTVDFF